MYTVYHREVSQSSAARARARHNRPRPGLLGSCRLGQVAQTVTALDPRAADARSPRNGNGHELARTQMSGQAPAYTRASRRRHSLSRARERISPQTEIQLSRTRANTSTSRTHTYVHTRIHVYPHCRLNTQAPAQQNPLIVQPNVRGVSGLGWDLAMGWGIRDPGKKGGEDGVG